MTDYAVVNLQTLEVFKSYSGYSDIPDPVVWPNGDASHGALLGDERIGCRFVKIEYDQAPGEFYASTLLKTEVAGDTMFVRREWTPNNLDETKAVVTERLKSRASEEIAGLVSPAELARALVAGKVPDWAPEVRQIDASLDKALQSVQSAATVDEVENVAL